MSDLLRSRPRLHERRLSLGGLSEVAAADEQERDRDRCECDRAADPERPLEAAGQCSGAGGAGVDQRLEVGGSHGRGDRDADRASDLL